MTKPKISNSPDKRMYRVELRRARKSAGLFQHELAAKMSEWGWYREKVTRLEDLNQGIPYFCLCPTEMQALRDALET